MKITVMGATGALGHSIVDKAIEKGIEVNAFVRNTDKILFSEDVHVFIGDASNNFDVEEGIKDADILFYCVNTPIHEWKKTVVPLLQRTINSCKRNDVKLVFPGNVWVYGKEHADILINEDYKYSPDSNKGRIRVKMEEMIMSSGVHYTILRIPELYGPNVTNKLIGSLFKNSIHEKPLIWYGGKLDVDMELIYIEDAAEAFLKIGISKETDCEIFHMSGYSKTTPREFLNEISEQSNKKLSIRKENIFLMKLAGLFNHHIREWTDILHLWTHPILLDESKYVKTIGNIIKTDYKEGIEKTLNWFKENPNTMDTID